VTEPNSSRRSWLVPVLVLVGAVALVLAGSVLTLSRYQPLSTTADSAVVGAREPTSTLAYAGKRVQVVQYVDHATMRYSFVLHNAGPVGVTVTGLDMRSGPGLLVHMTGYAVGGRTIAEAAAPQERFHSFGLGNGADRVVTLTLEFVNCQRISARAGTNVEHVTVRYRGFGFVPRSQDIRLPDLLRIGSPANDERCPHVTAGSRPPG
jgi:hypothetical protein